MLLNYRSIEILAFIAAPLILILLQTGPVAAVVALFVAPLSWMLIVAVRRKPDAGGQRRVLR